MKIHIDQMKTIDVSRKIARVEPKEHLNIFHFGRPPDSYKVGLPRKFVVMDAN